MFHIYLFTKTIWILLCCIFKNASTTEITELSPRFFPNTDIEIPVLMCHAKYTGYNEVRWYKDSLLLKKGAADEYGHVLSLIEIFQDPKFHFEHLGELQGYYSCETDYPGPTVVFRYLFRIPNIDTYVGWFISTKDSLGGSETNLTLNEKIMLKKEIYINEMETQLFGFIPTITVHITDIQIVQNGLVIRYYLYHNRSTLDKRRRYASELHYDQDELKDIKDYILNDLFEPSDDENFHTKIKDWMTFRGIDKKNFTDALKSTLGCAEESYSIGNDSSEEINWPLAYIGEVVIPEESCSSKSGKAVTRLCTGSFTIGATWGVPSRKCFTPPDHLTAQLTTLYNKFGNDHPIVYIKKLRTLAKHIDQLTVTDLHRVAEILEAISKKELETKDIKALLSVFDDIAETNRTQLSSAKKEIKLSSRLLKVLDNLLKQDSIVGEEVLITKHHLLLSSLSTEALDSYDDHMKGMAIHEHKGNLKNGSVEVITNDKHASMQDSLAFFLLPQDLIIERENETIFPHKCKMNVIFFSFWWMFQGPESALLNKDFLVFPTPVLHVTLSGGPAWNLQDPVKIFFKNRFRRKVKNPVCVHFEPRLYDGEGGWSTEGCEFVGLKEGFFECHCHHLSTYSILLKENPFNEKNFHLGPSVYAGCGLSIIALSMIVLMYLLSKVWRVTVDHSILFWIALSFLCCLILIFISEMKSVWKPGCLLMSMVLHYTILVVLVWLMVQAVMHRLRFAKKTDIEEVPHFLWISGLISWGAPIIIILIVWFVKDYTYYKEPTCWRTVLDVSNVAIFPIVALFLITLTINICAMYSVTCRFKKDFLIGDSMYKDSVIKFRVANSIYLFFVLSWLFGFLALHYIKWEFRVLFSICITLTSYYLALFFIFHEFSFWDIIKKWKESREEKNQPPVQYIPKNETSDETP